MMDKGQTTEQLQQTEFVYSSGRVCWLPNPCSSGADNPCSEGPGPSTKHKKYKRRNGTHSLASLLIAAAIVWLIAILIAFWTSYVVFVLF